MVSHGGQNPLEATRYGCNILHGPNISNFNEIYKFLKMNKISTKVTNQKSILKELRKLLFRDKRTTKIQRKLELIGKNILLKTYKEISLIYKNEI